MNNIDKQHSWDRIHGLLVTQCELKWASDSDSSSHQVEENITRLIADSKALKKIQEIVAPPNLVPLLTDEQISQLKQLVSIAVWIRGEQLAHPNAVILPQLLFVEAKSSMLERHIPIPTAEIDTHNMNVSRARAEFEAGQQLFTLLQQYCEQHGIPSPEWVK